MSPPPRRFAPVTGAAVILVRHADVPVDGGADPSLSPAGQARAAALAGVVGPAGIGTVIVSSARRTQETAAPVAAALGVTPLEITEPSEILSAIAAASAASTVLVVGHTNTVPDVIIGLGGPAVAIPHTDFGHVFVVTGGRLTHLHYGA
jgi:phosphohistidine phosphatase SixA